MTSENIIGICEFVTWCDKELHVGGNETPICGVDWDECDSSEPECTKAAATLQKGGKGRGTILGVRYPTKPQVRI